MLVSNNDLSAELFGRLREQLGYVLDVAYLNRFLFQLFCAWYLLEVPAEMFSHLDDSTLAFQIVCKPCVFHCRPENVLSGWTSIPVAGVSCF
jgi:hypothetical protein